MLNFQHKPMIIIHLLQKLKFLIINLYIFNFLVDEIIYITFDVKINQFINYKMINKNHKYIKLHSYDNLLDMVKNTMWILNFSLFESSKLF